MNAVVSTPRTARVRAIHQMAALFPEVPGLDASLCSTMPGFAEPGPGVPALKPRFIMEQGFIEEFTYFMKSPSAFVICLTGPTGCGKTERVLQYFARLNVPVLHSTAHRSMKLHDLVGSRELKAGPNGATETPFMPGQLVKAMKYGYPFLLDEAYRLSSAITSKLHMIRDAGMLTIDETGETIKAAPGFKMILTANQRGYGDDTGLYGGDSDQDQAWLNGMASIECDYPLQSVETEIVNSVLVAAHPAFATEPSLLDFGAKMVKAARKVRSQYVGNEDSSSTDARVEIALSTRNLIQWADAFVAFRGSSNPVHPLYRALDFVALRKGCKATRTFVDSVLLAEFGIARTQT